MPWAPNQQRAIAARMRAQGKSSEEIAAFFRAHSKSPKHAPANKAAALKKLRKK